MRYVELKATLAQRLLRNRNAHRLAHKPSKRDVEASEASLLHFEANYRMNSRENELAEKQVLVVDNTNAEPPEVARLIKQWLDGTS